MKFFILTLLIYSSAFALELAPQVYSLKPSDGKVKFLAVGRPSALKIRGEGEGPAGEITIDAKKTASGKIQFNLDSLETGISLRDSHMKEKYLQTKEFPKAEFILENLDTAKVSEGQTLSVPGKLKLHGKEQAVMAQLTLEKSGNALNLKATFPLKLGEFGIDIPKYMGITVAENVEVEVESKVLAKN